MTLPGGRGQWAPLAPHPWEVAQRLVLAAALAVATLAGPQAADAVVVCRYVDAFGGACVYVDPTGPMPVRVTCGGEFWTCA